MVWGSVESEWGRGVGERKKEKGGDQMKENMTNWPRGYTYREGRRDHHHRGRRLVVGSISGCIKEDGILFVLSCISRSPTHSVL